MPTTRQTPRRPCSPPTWRCASTRSTNRSPARFLDNPDQFADAFARAWFKLIHRDMGPLARYLGPEMPNEELLWQDPLPGRTTPSDADIAALKARCWPRAEVAELVSTAWAAARPSVAPTSAAAPTAARLRLAPQKDWRPTRAWKVLAALEKHRSEGGNKVSWPT
jgi:catalase-peroxidase